MDYKHPIFSDSKLHQHFLEHGYVIIPNLYSQETCSELVQWYDANPSGLNRGFHTSIHSNDVDYRRAVTGKVCSCFDVPLQSLLDRYRPVFSSFTVKEPDSGSGFDLHLDWSMVDERRHTSLTVWVPLVDITDDNGFLWVLPGSHRFHYTIRGGPGLNLWCGTLPTRWTEHYELKRLKLKMGDALIYDHRLFHGSPPNRTETRRLAINHTLIPLEAESLHYQFHGHSVVEVLKVPDDFYHTHILNTPPSGVKSIQMQRVQGCFVFQHAVNMLVVDSRAALS
jgi:hypothetical protein